MQFQISFCNYYLFNLFTLGLPDIENYNKNLFGYFTVENNLKEIESIKSKFYSEKENCMKEPEKVKSAFKLQTLPVHAPPSFSPWQT